MGIANFDPSIDVRDDLAHVEADLVALRDMTQADLDGSYRYVHDMPTVLLMLEITSIMKRMQTEIEHLRSHQR